MLGIHGSVEFAQRRAEASGSRSDSGFDLRKTPDDECVSTCPRSLTILESIRRSRRRGRVEMTVAQGRVRVARGVYDLHSGKRAGLQKSMLCGRNTKSSANDRCGLHGNARSASRYLSGLRFPSVTLDSPLPGMLQGIGGDHVDVDNVFHAELEFIEESENAGTRAGR